MKKPYMIALAAVMALSLCACGNSNNQETTAPTTKATTAPTTQTTTAPTILPTIPSEDTTMGTNIPDPSVDTSMPEATTGTSTDTTGTTNAGTNGMSRGNMR